MTTATITVKDIKTAIASGLSSAATHTGAGSAGAARIYLKAGCLLSIDEVMTLSIKKQNAIEKQRGWIADSVISEISVSTGRTTMLAGKWIYLGYDNANEHNVYSRAMNISIALKAIGVNFNVEGHED
jgi:uncharacterized spore protein YtfJ